MCYDVRRNSEFKLFRLLRCLSNSSDFSLFISPFHHPATRSFFSLVEITLKPLSPTSRQRPLFFLFPASGLRARAFSFFIRTNRSESPRRNGINSRFTDLLARWSFFLFKRFIRVCYFYFLYFKSVSIRKFQDQIKEKIARSKILLIKF